MCVSRSVMPDSFRPHGLQPTRLLCEIFPGKDSGVGCHFLLHWVGASNLDLKVMEGSLEEETKEHHFKSKQNVQGAEGKTNGSPQRKRQMHS